MDEASQRFKIQVCQACSQWKAVVHFKLARLAVRRLRRLDDQTVTLKVFLLLLAVLLLKVQHLVFRYSSAGLL